MKPNETQAPICRVSSTPNSAGENVGSTWIVTRKGGRGVGSRKSRWVDEWTVHVRRAVTLES
jgi:hypothetical protein